MSVPISICLRQLNERVAEKKATEAVESEKLMKKIQKKVNIFLL